MEVVTIKRKQLHVDYYPHILDPISATECYEMLDQNALWNKDRSVKVRNTAVYGNPDCSYESGSSEYSNDRQTLPWELLPQLIPLKDIVKLLTGQECNFCVIQRYPNGRIGINPHKDREIPDHSLICGMSLGTTRILRFIPPPWLKDTEAEVDIPLDAGSLYIMRPPTNKYWMHSIVKEPEITEPRISLTFRLIPQE